MSELYQESWSVVGARPSCRWAALRLRDEAKARELAQEHARTGHEVDVFVERSRKIARYGTEKFRTIADAFRVLGIEPKELKVPAPAKPGTEAITA